MTSALETVGLGKRYSRKWALRDCTLHIPTGCIAGLVGPNGAGKTTLLNLATGQIKPTQGSLQVLGIDPVKQARKVLPRLGLVSQDHPLYTSFSLQDMLTWGRKLNPRWNDTLARQRLQRLGLPLEQHTGTLSGGQQAQLALLLALAKQPELLILDEPMASLDPLARREFQQLLQEVAAEQGLTILLSSHIVADLERFCNYLVILSASRVQLASPVDELLQSHKLLVGPCEQRETLARSHTILESSNQGGQCHLLVHLQSAPIDPIWQVQDASLESVVLAYLAQPAVSMTDQPGQLLEVTR